MLQNERERKEKKKGRKKEKKFDTFLLKHWKQGLSNSNCHYLCKHGFCENKILGFLNVKTMLGFLNVVVSLYYS